MAATLRDVAELAGVSPSTVSRVVRGASLVSSASRVKVERAIEQIGYRPDTAARIIRTGTSHAVGYVVPDISNWFYSVVFGGAQQVLIDAGYELVLATSGADRERERHAIDSLLSRRIDGFILSLTDEDARHLPKPLRGAPIVLLDRECDDLDADIILSDHAAGIRTAVSHLIDLGHRRIALLAGKEDLYSTRSRLDAFRSAARSHGLGDNDLVERIGDRSVEAGERNAMELMRSADRPTALIAGSNQLLHGVLKAFNRLDVHLPRDVSLVACDDSDICHVHRPGISVVKRDVERMGREAASMLITRLEGGSQRTTSAEDAPPRVRKVLDTEFVLRASTGPPPVSPRA